MNRRERFLAAISGAPVDRPPVWLMRQAGRYLPGYRAVRAEHSFWEVCKTPELSTKVALEPLARFPLDAAIVFSDILVIPDALGLGVHFDKGEGPRLERTIRTEADLAGLHTENVMDRLAFMPAALKHLAATLNGSHGLVGFAGAPFTLFAYSVEGGGSDDYRLARTLLHTNPAFAKKALALIADVIAELVDAQCEAGADAVQLFDTWGGLLTREEYATFCVPALQRLAKGLQAKGRKVLLFVRGGHHLLPLFAETGCDGFSLDWRTPFTEARAALPKALLQGNLDPVLLFSTPEVVRAQTQTLLSQMKAVDGGKRCIVNLGHGILPGTPEANVAALVDAVVAS